MLGGIVKNADKTIDLAAWHRNLVVWVGLVWFLYAAVNTAGNYINEGGSKQQIKYNARSQATHHNNLIIVGVVFGMLLYPNVVASFVKGGFLPFFSYFLAVFVLLFEASEQMTHLTLTAQLFKNKIGLAIVTVSLAIVVWFLYHHLALYATPGSYYTSWFAIVLALHAIAFIVRPLVTGSYRVHLHHYYWPIPLARMCVYPESHVSMVACAMYCAVSFHGFAFFGVANLFYPIVAAQPKWAPRQGGESHKSQ
eukprot:g6658.t1